MSIRFRLTLLYSAILGATLLALSLFLYAAFDRASRLGTETALIEEGRRLQVNASGSSLLQGPYSETIVVTPRFPRVETYYQMLSPSGEVVERSSSLQSYVLPLSAQGLTAVNAGGTWLETTRTDNGRVMVYSVPISVNGKVAAIMQLARSLEAADRALANLRTLLTFGSSVVLGLAFVAGWFLAGTALRPIQRITATAQTIGSERSFDRRVDHRGPNDEIGRLAVTFNSMLEQLQVAYTQLQQALDAQRRFVADASHELRTPLTTLRGNIRLLQRTPPIQEEDRVAVLGDMDTETERLVRLVNDLLVLARSDAGRRIECEPVAIAPLIEDVCRQARLFSPSRTVQCDMSGDLLVTGDHDALKQVLLILLDNALKYSPKDGRVIIGASEANGTVDLAVSDNGAGIEPAALPHIFDRFYRADAARSRGGTGLGLAIAQTLVEAQGGTIEVASQVGVGSTFTVKLRPAPATDQSETPAAH